MLPIYIVSLPDSPKRRKMVFKMKRQNLLYSWVDGIRINSMKELRPVEYADLEGYKCDSVRKNPEYIKRACGCKRAMRRALQVVADSGMWGIILQDDAIPCLNFADKVESFMRRIPSDVHCVMLHCYGEELVHRNGLDYVCGNVRSMSAFVISPDFAREMAEKLVSWPRETDMIWEYYARRGVGIVLCITVKCTQKGSDIIGTIPELSHLCE